MPFQEYQLCRSGEINQGIITIKQPILIEKGKQ